MNLKCYNDTSVNNSLQNSSLDLDWPLQFFSVCKHKRWNNLVLRRYSLRRFHFLFFCALFKLNIAREFTTSVLMTALLNELSD